MCLKKLRCKKLFLPWGNFTARPFLLDKIFVFQQLELAHLTDCYLEIYALDIVFVPLQGISKLICFLFQEEESVTPRVIKVKVPKVTFLLI